MLSRNALAVLKERYLWTNPETGVQETPEEMFRRVARCIAGVEATAELRESYAEKYFQLLSGLYFLPNTPALINAGRHLGQLSACFVLPVEDSIDSIFEAVKHAAMIHKSGGGTGFSFSRLREQGAVVNSTGRVASGPVTFMEVFDAATDAIKQGGVRRGANMGLLRVDHPDILQFINAKRQEGRFSNFNISVGLTDRFMQALEQDEMFELVSPRDGQVKRRVKAGEIMAAIVDNAWATGEPGVIFLDAVNRHNPLPALGEIEATNPCVTGDTLVATPDGYRPARDFQPGDLVLTVLGRGAVAAVEKHENYPVFRVEFSDGGVLRVTAAHQFQAQKRGAGRAAAKRFDFYRLDQLEVGDWVRVAPTGLPNNRLELETYGLSDREYGFLAGVLLGDGCIAANAMERRRLKVCSRRDDAAWNDILTSLLSRLGYTGVSYADRNSLSLSYCLNGAAALYRLVEDLGIAAAAEDKRIPVRLRDSNEQVLAGLLDGLFSTDGNVNLSSTHPTLRFASASRGLIADLRDVLLMFGIHGCMSIQTAGRQRVCQGRRINGQTKYEFIISGASLKVFYERIGLTRPHKRQRLATAVRGYSLTGNTWKARIISIEPDGFDTVYDLYEPASDTWITNGYVSRGCGEQPLLPYESCVLGSVNLSRHVRRLQDGRVEIDFPRLEQTVRLAVRFLDASIDASAAPLPEIQEMTRANRKIGLGVMGWADLLLALGIRYDSQAALDLVPQVMGSVYQWADDESRRLAREKGPFPNAYLAEETVRGRRNATVTTIAPTGSISLIAGCSSGIEPIFGYVQASKRRVVSDVLIEVNQMAARWCRDNGVDLSELLSEFKSLEEAVAAVDKLNAYLKGVLPEYFVTAYDVSPEWHVRMQAAFQRYVENAISKSVNLPNHATRKDVEQVYLLGYKLGLKGLTVYRDGSREEQVIYSTSRPAASVVRTRPEEMPARNFKVKLENGKTAYLTVSLDEGSRPFEIFANSLEGLDKPWNEEALFRLVSIALRANVPVREVCRQLDKANRERGGHMFTTPALIRRVLLKVAGESLDEGLCPHCGAPVRREGGCLACPCGQSSRCD